MNENETLPSNHKILKGLRVFLFCLLVFDFLLLAWNLPDFVRGAADMYPNQNARLVTGNLGQIFLVSAMLFSNQAQLSKKSSRCNYIISGVLLLLSFVLISVQLWLSA